MHDVSVYIHISMDLWHLNNARSCVCVRVSADRNEGHPDDLELQVEEADGDLSILFLFLNSYFACMYEEYLHSLTSSDSPVDKLLLVKRVPPLLLHSLFTC